MTRRLLLALFALIGTLLVTMVVPLGVMMSVHERDGFRDESLAAARSLAAVAEERLADGRPDVGLGQDLARIRPGGEAVAVFDRQGGRIAAADAGDVAVPPDLPSDVVRTGRDREISGPDRLLVLVPVVEDDRTVGALALSRPTAPLTGRLRALWTGLAAVGLVGLVAAALVAMVLARWVSRPLQLVDGAAQRLGEGDLDARAEVGDGPPEVRRLATSFNTMAARLETLVHGHRAVIADVSHQLRTPLAALRLRLDLLAQDAGPVTAVELAGAQEEIARLSRLVDGLLAVARAENSMPQPVIVEADTVVRERVEAWRPVADERGVGLSAACPAPVLVTLGDGHLEQILDNLLANALEATPRGGHVEVGVSQTPGGGRIVVVDDGPGMSQDRRATAFLRFAGTGEAKGTGLGLAIVHRLVTSDGGTARLEDTPGGGLTAVLDLPGARDRGARSPNRRGQPTPAGSCPAALLPNHKIFTISEPFVNRFPRTRLARWR